MNLVVLQKNHSFLFFFSFSLDRDEAVGLVGGLKGELRRGHRRRTPVASHQQCRALVQRSKHDLVDEPRRVRDLVPGLTCAALHEDEALVPGGGVDGALCARVCWCFLCYLFPRKERKTGEKKGPEGRKKKASSQKQIRLLVPIVLIDSPHLLHVNVISLVLRGLTVAPRRPEEEASSEEETEANDVVDAADASDARAAFAAAAAASTMLLSTASSRSPEEDEDALATTGREKRCLGDARRRRRGEGASTKWWRQRCVVVNALVDIVDVALLDGTSCRCPLPSVVVGRALLLEATIEVLESMSNVLFFSLETLCVLVVVLQ